MRTLFAVLICCTCAIAQQRPQAAYVNGTLISFRTVDAGSSCYTNGTTGGQVSGEVDDYGNISGTVTGHTSSSTSCVPRQVAYYTLAVGNQTYILTPGLTKREGFTALATLGYSRLFEKASVLYGLPAGTPIQVRAEGSAIYVRVSERESKYRIEAVSGDATAPTQGTVRPSNPAAASIDPALLSSALSGDANAEFTLGSKYASGQGVPKDYALAAVWDRKAAEQGNTGAELALGAIYFMGEGVPRDYAQASLWWDKAAEQGDATAHYALGMMYANGQGVPQNFSEAYYRYSLAAQGVIVGIKPEEVASDRDAAAAHLSPSELANARERVRQWLASHAGQVATR